MEEMEDMKHIVGECDCCEGNEECNCENQMTCPCDCCAEAAEKMQDMDKPEADEDESDEAEA
jgi:hypothetical protein